MRLVLQPYRVCRRPSDKRRSNDPQKYGRFAFESYDTKEGYKYESMVTQTRPLTFAPFTKVVCGMKVLSRPDAVMAVDVADDVIRFAPVAWWAASAPRFALWLMPRTTSLQLSSFTFRGLLGYVLQPSLPRRVSCFPSSSSILWCLGAP